ncbi:MULTISPECIES: tyrosine-type recombinase/integrase [unclassified Novosphingobium]|uniref:tyrosine-type recombinase/integrase n=1 Tax=unclassified Novosphingobium TaxID=2644732 RepID=UPI001359C630|nr:MULTISPECIES: tyrosine-type recombinase/integrase [unclassified Novosphingobium]
MARLPKLKHVKFTRSKGKVYAYFDTGRKTANGNPIRLPLPPFGTVGFYDSYSSFLGARTKRQVVLPTISDLAALYQNSDDFKERSEGTKNVYRITLKRVLREFGEFPLEDVTRKRVYDVLDEIPGPASRNLFVAVMGVLFRYARSRDMTESNPVKDIRKSKTGEHEPWPQHVLTAALISDDDMVRLAVHILYFTGQRLGDVVKLRWSDVRGSKIILTQEKTSKPMMIPMHRDLLAEIERKPRLGMTIISEDNGKPVTASKLRNALKAFGDGLGVAVVPHGLRKNAVNILLTNGCTIPEVQAITGQSVEMVMHYAKQVDQGALGEAAILKFERGNRT